MYICDFETTTAEVDKEKSWVWLWGLKGTLEQDEMVWDAGKNSIKTFLEYVSEHNLDNLYFHNITFDGNFIYKYFFDVNMKWIDNDNLDYELENMEWRYLCDHRGNIFTMEVNYNNHTFKMFDSWKVLMASVEDLGNSIGKPKLELDYDLHYQTKKDVPKQAIEYLERDIDVVIQTFTKFTSLYEKKITRASMAYEDFKDFYGQNNFVNDFGGKKWDFRNKCFKTHNILSRNEWNLVHRSYSGGYVNWNQLNTDKVVKTKNGVSYDINSLYPSVMLKYKMPYGKMLYSKPHEENYLTLYVVEIYSANAKNQFAPGLFKERNSSLNAKYLNNIKYEERVYWKEEFEFLLKHYDMEYNIYQKRYFKCKYVFSEWIKSRQDLKINAPNKVEQDAHKGVLNSLYGKFAQNYKLGERIFVKDGKNKSDWAKNEIRYGKNGEWRHKSRFKDSDSRKHIAVASYITCKSRLQLWQCIFDNLDTWLYTDTDSGYFSDEPRNITIHDTNFGDWKPEHKFSYMKVLRAKCYMLQVTSSYKNGKWNDNKKLMVKASGLSQEGKKQINWNNFYIGSVIKNGKKGKRNVKGGLHIITQDFKLGEIPEYKRNKINDVIHAEDIVFGNIIL